MPRKKASNNTQSSSPLRQPTLAGFINSKSASMANPGEGPQSTVKTTTTPKQSKYTKSLTPSTSKSATKSTSTAEPKIGPPTSKRRSSRRGSDTKRGRTKSPKKKGLARRESSSEGSGDDSDLGALKAIRFESQEGGTHTGGSTIELTSSSEDEDQVISLPRLKRTATQKMRAPSGSPSDSDIEVIGGSAGAPRKVKRRLKRRLMSSDEEDPSETEEGEGPSPKKRRLVKGIKPSTSEGEIDIKDEVDEHREYHPPNGGHDYSLQITLTTR
jgi:hypothetical protein